MTSVRATTGVWTQNPPGWLASDTEMYPIHLCILRPDAHAKLCTGCEGVRSLSRLTPTFAENGGTMTIPVTKRRENTRTRLLDAAAEVFAEFGLEGASVEAICERAGFTRGAFYSNFESKDELFLQLTAVVAERRLSLIRARIDEFVEAEVLRDDADPVDLVRQVMESGEDDRLS